MVKTKNAICMYCSLGCSLAFRTKGDEIIGIDYDKDDIVNKGSLCPRGYYNLELINHPKRLTSPRIGNRPMHWSDATCLVKDKLGSYNCDEVAILVSCNASNEDAYMATVLAKNLGTDNICAAGDNSDIEASNGTRWNDQSPRLGEAYKIANVDSLLIIGDILTRSAVLSKYVNKVKYGKRGNQVIVIDPNKTHTTWFATNHLKPRPGTEALLLAGILKVISEDNNKPIDIDLDHIERTTGITKASIIKTAKSFDDAENGTILFAPSVHKERNDLIQYFIDQISMMSPGKKHMTFYSFANTLGVTKVINEAIPGHLNLSDIEARIDSGKIKSLFIIGDEAYKAPSNMEFIIRASYFQDENIDENTILLPLASHLEKKGSVILTGRGLIQLSPIAHTIGSKSYWKSTSQILGITKGYDAVINETDSLIRKPISETADIHSKIKEVLSVAGKDSAPVENITHFGNNEHVKRFFWWRVNNG